MGVRMLGIDTPELHFPGTSSPDKQDPVLVKLPKNASFKKLPKGIREIATGGVTLRSHLRDDRFLFPLVTTRAGR